MDRLYLLGEDSIETGSLRWWPAPPGVVATARDAKKPAQHRDRVSSLLCLDEPEGAHRVPSSFAKKAAVGSTGRCNTVGFRCCPDRRCGSGEAGSAGRIVSGRQEGAVEAVESWRIGQQHRPGTTEGSRLHPRDARSHRGHLSARAAQAEMRAHFG